MKRREVPTHTPEIVVKTIFQHLVLRVDDLAVLILKGHLVIENMLTELLGKRVFRDTNGVAAAQLRFAQKVQLCRAWAPHPQVAKLWDLIGAINNLRNDLAHDLSTPERRKLVSNIRAQYRQLASTSRQVPADVPQGDEDVLIATFTMVAGVLLALINPSATPPGFEDIARQMLDAQQRA